MSGKTNRNLWIALIVVVVAVILVLAFTGVFKKAETQEIKIGIVGPHTGPVAVYGEAVRDAALVAIEEINAAGGVLGMKFVPVIEDTKGDGAEASNAVNKVITRDKVVAIIGPVISSTANVAGAIVNREKVPMIAPAATAVEVTHAGEYTSRVCFLDSYQATVMAKFSREELKAEKAAILIDVASDYSIGLKDVFAEKLVEYGGEIVEVVSYTSGDSDFSAQLTKIKAAAPDVIYLPVYYNDDILILRQARNLGITATFLGADGWDAPELIEGAGDAAEGCYFTTHYTIHDPSPVVQNFVQKFQEKYGKPPIVFNALGYDAVKMLADAIERAGSLDREEIKDAINSTENFEGVTGMITLDENRNPYKEVTIVTVKNGQFELVTKLLP